MFFVTHPRKPDVFRRPSTKARCFSSPIHEARCFSSPIHEARCFSSPIHEARCFSSPIHVRFGGTFPRFVVEEDHVRCWETSPGSSLGNDRLQGEMADVLGA